MLVDSRNRKVSLIMVVFTFLIESETHFTTFLIVSTAQYMPIVSLGMKHKMN